MNKIFSNLKWINFVSSRFNQVDSKSRSSAVTSRLSSIGIAFGVMALIVVMSVMNGFQMTFIDSIMELSSYHVRLSNLPSEEKDNFLDYCEKNKNIISVTPFYEAQGLMVGTTTSQSCSLIRALPSSICKSDSGFKKEMKITSGDFDLSEENSIVLGSSLARQLGCHVGSQVNILAMSGSSDVSLISQERIFNVTGIFSSGYADINSTYAFINLEDGEKYFGQGAKLIYGIKIKNYNSDQLLVKEIKEKFPNGDCQSWREYNRSFFGALRVEKNIMMLLVLLIFLVVAVNIYNGMRRMVFERSQEIAILSALGARRLHVQMVFILKGLTTGIKGAFWGLLSGIFLTVNMRTVFIILSKLQYYFQYVFTALFNPAYLDYINENQMFRIYSNIPARMQAGEIIFIVFFGTFSAVLASYFAGRKIFKMTVTEVLRNE